MTDQLLLGEPEIFIDQDDVKCGQCDWDDKDKYCRFFGVLLCDGYRCTKCFNAEMEWNILQVKSRGEVT